MVVMLCRAYQQELTFVAFESLIKSMPRLKVEAANPPKSVTMPIATVVSQGHGGTMAITVAAVVVTGMLGNLCAPLLVKLFRVKDPMAVGLGIGACSHAMGTAKALELGETEGAMSGLAIGLCGILTTVLALFAGFFVA